MNSQEYDQIEEVANRLQHEASVKCSRELEKAQKYKEGYTQGVEDLIRTLSDHNRGPEPPKEGWQKQMYNQFMKGTDR